MAASVRFKMCVGATMAVVCSLALLSARENSVEKHKFWVFFADKGTSDTAERSQVLEKASVRLSERALRRRARVRKPGRLLDERDLAVAVDYLAELRTLGLEPVVVSNWLNGASFWLDSTDVARVRRLPFVKEVRPVSFGRPHRKPERTSKASEIDFGGNTDLDYGQSLQQNRLINVTSVHDLGIVGKDVWIGLLDTGFKHGQHEAFAGLKVITERDFINDDDIVEDEAGQDAPGQHQHGTQVLSTIAGFQEGQIIGTAFDASFLLAKTEVAAGPDTRAEEDFWVAGLEWLEAQGADIVSSSVVYLAFYTPEDMDGNTAVTTMAADLAASRGVVVVNAAGNEGNDAWRIIASPADGDSVIAVGAAALDSSRAGFSSVGPTADGRIKPDMAALGSMVYVASAGTNRFPSPYDFVSGTSVACPQVSGVAALVLSAHPELTPGQVWEALRFTASQVSAPDNALGWGIVNALNAVLFHGPAFSNSPDVRVNNNSDLEIDIKVASTDGIDPGKVFLFYKYPNQTSSFDSLSMLSGSEAHQFNATVSLEHEQVGFYFRVTDLADSVAFHPHDAPASIFTFPETPVSVPDVEAIPRAFKLAQNYPNPFNPETTLSFELPRRSQVTLKIYNMLGQEVRTLLSAETKPAGRFRIIWDGRDDAGRRVVSGLYVYRLFAPDFQEARKMLLIR